MIAGTIHSCYLHSTDQQLNYDGGTKVFTVGKTCTGTTSHATGTIKTVTLSIGSWTGGTAAGNLILTGVSGTFLNNEAISDDGTIPGASVVNGANADYVDAYGQKATTVSVTATNCRFYNAQKGGGDQPYGWSGFFPAVMFPAGTSVSKGQRLTSSETGFTGIFLIEDLQQYYSVAGVDHITCFLKEVPA